MNYRHIYHAGNFTEVVKHSILTLILNYLRLKSSPFCYIDMHAGEGIYDLTSDQAEKTREAAAGVQRMLASDYLPPDCLQTYLTGLEAYQQNGCLCSYPGSPSFAANLLRPQDQMILNEYHPDIYQRLRRNFYKNPQVSIHQRDAYEFLPAILPPIIKRGLVLIDPPFESCDEDKKIQTVLKKSLLRWAQGVYLVWYPITRLRHWEVRSIGLQNQTDRYLTAKLTIIASHQDNPGLLGCELLIINPPWQLATTLKILLQYLWEIFSIDHQGGWSVH